MKNLITIIIMLVAVGCGKTETELKNKHRISDAESKNKKLKENFLKFSVVGSYENMYAESTSNLPVISKIQPFALTNQNSVPITHTSLIGTPWLANIIFTRCPTVCPKLTQTLSQLRSKLPAQLNYISLTTDPTFDTPEKLKAFAEANGSNETNWHFLTGPKDVLMKLAVEDLKLVSLPKEKARQENPSDLFVHSSLYILVDSKGQVRAYFEHDATNLVQMIQTALEKLEKE